MGHLAAQVLGGVDVDEHGVAGVEKSFDQRLRTDAAPLRLSIDVRVAGGGARGTARRRWTSSRRSAPAAS